MSSRDAATRYSVLLVLGLTLAQFEIGPTGAERLASAHEAVVDAAAVTFTIPLATLDDVRRLNQRPEVTDVIRTARTYSDSPIFLAAYVTADDVRSSRADAGGVSDELVIEMGGYLASQGVEPERVSGKGMGIDPTIGRAVVVSFGITAPPSELGSRVLQVVRKSLPGRATLGMDSGSYGL
jgi:hypothetical protein